MASNNFDETMERRMGWVVALIVGIGSALTGFGVFSARAGALEQRVGNLERVSNQESGDMQKLLESMARIEQEVKDIDDSQRLQQRH